MTPKRGILSLTSQIIHQKGNTMGIKTAVATGDDHEFDYDAAVASYAASHKKLMAASLQVMKASVGQFTGLLRASLRLG